MSQLVKFIKNNPKKSLINEIRELRLKGDQTYKKKKTFLNYITPNCSVKKRNIKREEDYTKNFIAPSSYIYFDFDDVVNAKEYKEYFIEKYGHLVSLVCLSSSGGGISVFFKLTNTVDNKNYLEIWETIKATHLKEEQVDLRCKNLGRAMYLTYDTEPFVNYENEITVEIPFNSEKRHLKKQLNQSILNKKYINTLIEPLSNIDFEEFMDKIVTKTPVVVKNPIVELFASEKMDITFPREIRDTKKHSIYTIIIHKLVFLNPMLPASYLFSYLNFINNYFGKPPMEYKKLKDLFLFVYTSIKNDENYEFINKKYKFVHFNSNSKLTGGEKRNLASKINGKRRSNSSIEKIITAKKEMKSQGLKITQKALAKKTGLSISTIKRYINSEPVDLEKLVIDVNELYTDEDLIVDIDAVFLSNEHNMSTDNIFHPECHKWIDNYYEQITISEVLRGSMSEKLNKIKEDDQREK
ncbi:BT4734/BF3469 family protein [uncultured Polaribacter sp.]|uniref:BT4734/BF3469 family protein n=1 Tax=uncultured Polaribacter sp. TaxID=174711 RepID=UPI002620DBEC|nr:BT4734/BF3469 family protein [uncultured Polaribacter sp.]